MADIPLLKLARLGFEMELQAEGIGTERKRLVFIQRVRGKARRAVGQVEAVAVSVQHHGILLRQV
jgi:hypothetical protein